MIQDGSSKCRAGVVVLVETMHDKRRVRLNEASWLMVKKQNNCAKHQRSWSTIRRHSIRKHKERGKLVIRCYTSTVVQL